MNTSSFNYLFGIDGNFTVRLEEMNRATGEFTAKVQKAQGWLDRFVGFAGKIDILSDGIIKGTQAIASLGQGGITLNTSMTDLQAVTGGGVLQAHPWAALPRAGQEPRSPQGDG